MQAATTNDTYVFNLFNTDGVTPFATTGAAVNGVALLIKSPTSLQTITAGPQLIVGTNSVTLKTLPTHFPVAGVYQVEIIVTFQDGTVSKSRVFPITIAKSLA